ncbi:MAG: GAF domain-containing protein, partial [Patulibacter sp.]
MARASHDPWTAVEAVADPLRHALRLAHAHESARSGARVGAAIRPVVDRSWQRSAAAGVDPTTIRTGAPLDADRLDARRAEHPLLAVRSTLSRVLRDLAASAPHVFAISDEHGILLWVDGPEDVVERASHEMAFEAGADWSERAAGTNAVGTALAENHAVQIFSAEHFRPAVHAWTCSGAPIHDPETGRVIGALDATADLRTVSPRTLPIVQAAARAAEITLRARATERDARLRQRALHR